MSLFVPRHKPHPSEPPRLQGRTLGQAGDRPPRGWDVAVIAAMTIALACAIVAVIAALCGRG